MVRNMNHRLQKMSCGFAAVAIVMGAMSYDATAEPAAKNGGGNDAPQAASDAKLRLKNEGDTFSRDLDSLEKSKGIKPVALGDVLQGAHKSTPSGIKCGTDDHPKSGFCWDKGDNLNPEWYPQGITASWDAYGGDGKYANGDTVVAASWYLKGKAARISFSDRERKTYDHVALAELTDNKNDIEPIATHAGGIAWVGNYLYVADTGRGMRVFDLRHIWKADPSSQEYKATNGKVTAGGYKYVLPEVGRYSLTPDGTPCQTGKNPVISSVSVDRKSETLVTGEYCGSQGDSFPRVIRWRLALSKDQNTNGLLKPSKDSDKFVTPSDSHDVGLLHMQGVVTHGSDVWMTESNGKDHKGTWYQGRITDHGVTLDRESRMCTQGPEDLTYRNDNSVWTLTEHPDERQVFPVQKSKDCTPPG
jgi:hypothetical protein